LRVECGIDAAPHVKCVVSFDIVLAAVIQFAVAGQEADPSEGQILLILARKFPANPSAAARRSRRNHTSWSFAEDAP
jgi:hypothetical protein